MDEHRKRDPGHPRFSLDGWIRPSRFDVPFATKSLVPKRVQERVLEQTVLLGSTWQDRILGELVSGVNTNGWDQEIGFASLCIAASKRFWGKQSLFNMLFNKRRRNTNRRWKENEIPTGISNI